MGLIEPQVIERAIEVFREFHPQVDDEEGYDVQNLCDAFSERFRDMLLAFALIWSGEEGSEWKIEWFDLDDNRPLPDVYPYSEIDPVTRQFEGHCVFRLGETCYDWTIRQYTPDTPVPFIWDASNLEGSK